MSAASFLDAAEALERAERALRGESVCDPQIRQTRAFCRRWGFSPQNETQRVARLYAKRLRAFAALGCRGVA